MKQDGTGDFASIQEAIDVADGGDTITVYPGTYYENIQFNGTNIILRSSRPWNNSVVESTIIDGGSNGSVITLIGTEAPSCMVSGFTITNGRSEGSGGGVLGGTQEGDW
ncbi:hypothetical protein J7M28_04070 [bacterium]|nr:hypothetical protein [bacterium]